MLATAISKTDFLNLEPVAIVKLKQKGTRCCFLVEVNDEEKAETNGRVYYSPSQISLASVLSCRFEDRLKSGNIMENVPLSA